MADHGVIPSPVDALVERGVVIPCPAAVEIDPELDPARIAAGVVIHTGCKVLGTNTSIGPGCVLGAEAPVTLEHGQLGANVELRGGYFAGATFLDGVQVGSGAHVREGTLLEEEARGAHAVGFKQTILFPYVTAGSLINFCDVLMAGGTSRKDHSEVGSSYVHFNYTPHQDKATASLIGDVPRGVMLDQSTIFLGGQGGLVGPVRIGYGTTIAAGTIYRADAVEGGRLLTASSTGRGRGGGAPYDPAVYGLVDRIVRNNLVYIGNIIALQRWYEDVRRPFMRSDAYGQACYDGARVRLRCVRDERIRRLGELAEKMEASIRKRSSCSSEAGAGVVAQQAALKAKWPEMAERLAGLDGEGVGDTERETFLAGVAETGSAGSHLQTVRRWSPQARVAGRAWLQAIVDSVEAIWHPVAS